MLMQRLCFAVGFLLLQLLSVRAEPIIWLAPLSSVTFDNKPGAADYMSLFQPDASWQQVAKVTSVFKIYPTFAGRASDDILRAVFADLKRRGMALALEARILSSTVSCTMLDAKCNLSGGTEGSTTAQKCVAQSKTELRREAWKKVFQRSM